MFKVLGKLHVGKLYCVSVEGDTSLLIGGMKLVDENGYLFVIESIGMPHYYETEHGRTHAELVLGGDVENIGSTLSVIRE